MDTNSHKRRILAYLQEHGSITPMEALQEFGCYRLGARIWDLRQTGVQISTEIVREKRRLSLFGSIFRRTPGEVSYARYRLQ
jgi:hypothetical protein